MIRRTRSISFTSTPGMLDAANDTTAAGAVVTGATLADTAGALPTGDPFLETMQRAQTVQAPAFRKVLFSFYQYNL